MRTEEQGIHLKYRCFGDSCNHTQEAALIETGERTRLYRARAQHAGLPWAYVDVGTAVATVTRQWVQ